MAVGTKDVNIYRENNYMTSYHYFDNRFNDISTLALVRYDITIERILDGLRIHVYSLILNFLALILEPRTLRRR